MNPDLLESQAEPVTSWTLLSRANDPELTEEARRAARQEVIHRYLAFADRCLLLAVRERRDLVPGLLSDFSLRVMNGKATVGADPDRGRFRNYLRTILANLVTDHYRGRCSAHEQLNEAQEAELIDRPFDEEAFRQQWRIELTMQAMQVMGQSERTRDRELYAVLQLQMTPEKLSQAEMAVRLTQELGRPVDAVWVGKQLFNARERLRELVRREVRKSLENPTNEAVDEELADLGMLAFVRGKQ